MVLNINPGNLTVTDTSISGNWTGPNGNYDDDGAFPWLDLEIGNHQWTPHPFKAHGPTHTTPCEEIPEPFETWLGTTDPIWGDWDIPTAYPWNP